MQENIYELEDLFKMLDSLLREPSHFWDDFYLNREKNIPFFVNAPDENLVSYFNNQIITSGKVLELGCGPGRNAIYFAEKGCFIDAVDLSSESLKWASERAYERNISVNFIHKNIFELDIEENTYDIIYDSGCFHHIAPHRRMSYLHLVKRALKPNGYFAMTSFIPNGKYGGADISDWEVYQHRSLKGGLGYSEEKLRAIFKDFKEIEIRKMKKVEGRSDMFGVDGLMTSLFQKI
ncbi:class I SAM-dependent methyltransferase [Bacillus salitolerans]|uniref:Class I SAM-dependent methyltransferase n=1 Tax=Bacillus salitolerans TaxID=1437434 RepID=A0ABW4LVQ9_9BACI